MRRLALTALVVLAVCAFASSASALVVDIQGPGNVWVPYGQCAYALWTASPGGLETFDWTWDSQQVGTNSSYSRTWCSPELNYVTTEYGTLGLYATSGGYADYDSIGVQVIFEAGNENGGCGTQIWC